MFHVALADDMGWQRLLWAHFAVFEDFLVVAFDVVAEKLVVLGMMAGNVVANSEFKLFKFKQILHSELERGGAIASACMILHSANALFQRLHRLDDWVYHQLRTHKITAKHIKTAQRGAYHSKNVVFFGEIVDFLDGSSNMMVNFKCTPFIIRIIKVQEAHRLCERRASETMDINYLLLFHIF